jgi:phage terminase large subunit-like protein
LSKDLTRAAQLLEIVKEQLPKNQLYLYKPYPKQLEFHNTIATERCLMSGNQQGKTWCAGAETAMHALNDYAAWYKGRRYDGGIVIWASGVTSVSTRDNPQRILLGRPEQIGTGMIPESKITNVVKAAHGANNLCDYVQVVSNLVHTHQQGTSYIFFKSYEQGREKWQGESVHVVWFDEEPPLAIYSEGKTRTNARNGIVYLTFTPLLGMSNVVRRFIHEPSAQRITINMGIYDALHYTKEKADEILDGYPEHEREARGWGKPVLGSGAVYPVIESGIAVDAFEIPMHWTRICGIDFGWDHPTALVWAAWDRDTDVVYIYDCYSESRKIVSTHASVIKARGDWIPVAWPHDGMSTERGSGQPLINLYRKEGVKTLPEHAKYPDARGNSLEASVADVLNRMETGRFKVFRHLTKWFGEYRMYHRVEGKIVAMDDDLMSATRYLMMCLQQSRTMPDYQGLSDRYTDRYSGGGQSFMSM